MHHLYWTLGLISRLVPVISFVVLLHCLERLYLFSRSEDAVCRFCSEVIAELLSVAMWRRDGVWLDS